MRRNPVLLIISILVAVIIHHSIAEEDIMSENIPQQSQVLLSILSLLSGLIGADIFMTGIRLIW